MVGAVWRRIEATPSRAIAGRDNASPRSSGDTKRRAIPFLALGITSIALIACGGSSNKAAPADSGVTVAAPATAAAAPTTAPGKPTPPPPPPTPTGSPVAGGEAVAFATADGMTLKGNLYTVPGPKRRIVIFAADLNSGSEAAWQPFAKELAGSGVAALTFQPPQYGEGSARRDQALEQKDLESAVLFIESRDYPLVYIVGEGPAGTAALKLASHHNLAGVVAVSAPLTRFNLSVASDLAKVKAPKLFIAGSEPTSSADVEKLMQGATDPKQSKLFAAHFVGAELLTSPDGAAVKRAIKDFVTK